MHASNCTQRFPKWFSQPSCLTRYLDLFLLCRMTSLILFLDHHNRNLYDDVGEVPVKEYLWHNNQVSIFGFLDRQNWGFEIKERQLIENYLKMNEKWNDRTITMDWKQQILHIGRTSSLEKPSKWSHYCHISK